MTTFPASSVTGSLLSAALEMHAPSNPGSQFPVCRCGHSSMDVYRPRHLREVVRRTTGTLLVPTPLLGNPSVRAVELLTAALVTSSLEQNKELMPLVVTSRALVCAYSPAPDIPMLDPDAMITALDDTLHTHRPEEMVMDQDGTITLRCRCGHEVDEDLFESHCATEAAKAGCVYGTRVEMHNTYRSLMMIVDNVPSGLLRTFAEEASALLDGISKLRDHLNRAV